MTKKKTTTKKTTASKRPAKANAPHHVGTITRGDGRKVRVTVPRDEPGSGHPADKATKLPAKPADAARANTAAQSPKHKPPKTPAPSCLDSAAAVLKDAPDEGLSVKDMVALMAAKGLWSSPAGKTPEATVYAGIVREIGRKGKQSRFRKVSRGRFALASPTAA